MNLQCQDIDELLVDFLYHELEEPRAQAFQAHVDGCARCGAELSSLARMRQALHALPEAEPSPAVSARLLHEAARRAPKSSKSEEERGGVLAWIRGFFAPLARHPAWAGAIASIIVVVGLASVLTVSRKSVSMDVSTTRSVEPAAAAPAPPEAPAPTYAGETLKAEAPATAPPASEDKPAEPKAGKLDRVGRTTTPDEEGKIRPVSGEKKKKAEGPAFAAPADGLSGSKGAEVKGALDLGRDRQAETTKDFNNAPASDDRKQGAGAAGDPADAERAKAPALPSVVQAAPAPAQTESRAEPQRALSKEPPPPAAKPSKPASKTPVPEPTVVGNREQDKAQEKAPPTPPELYQQARKQATSGACNEALTIRDRIARVDPGYFKKNVAGDAEINRCLEQRRNKVDSKRPAAPSRLDEAEKQVDDKASKDAAH